MSSSTNNSTFLQEDAPGRYTSTSQQQRAPIIGDSSCSELHWTSEFRPESYVPTSFAPDTSSWPGAAFVYPGSAWPGDQQFDKTPSEPSFGASNGNAEGLETNLLVGMGVAAPVEPVFPAIQSVLPGSQPSALPAAHWTQAPEPFWQPTSWDHTAHTAGQHGNYNSSIGSLGMGPDVLRIESAAPSVTPGHSERRAMPPGRVPSMVAPPSVRLWTHSDPVPVVSSRSRPRRERWDLPMNTTPTTFQCLWTSGETRCMAIIAGDRRSITSHLRDEHDFTCDGRTIACAWDQCTVCMQRRNIPRHIIACHLEIKVTCSRCGLALSRADANKKHRLACTGGITKAAGATEGGEEDDGRLIF